MKKKIKSKSEKKKKKERNKKKDERQTLVRFQFLTLQLCFIVWLKNRRFLQCDFQLFS